MTSLKSYTKSEPKKIRSTQTRIPTATACFLYVTGAIKSSSSAKVGTATISAHIFARKIVVATAVGANAMKMREAG